MFAVVITDASGDKEYKHEQRKIALRQFEQYKAYNTTIAVTVVHATRRIDEVIACYERDENKLVRP